MPIRCKLDYSAKQTPKVDRLVIFLDQLDM